MRRWFPKAAIATFMTMVIVSLAGASLASAWASNANLSANPGLSLNPVIAVDPSSNVHVAWADDLNVANKYEILYRKRTGDTWSATQNLSNSLEPSVTPSLATDAAGGVHLVWLEQPTSGFYVLHRYWDGTSWSGPETIASTGGPGINPVERPVLAVDSSGDLHVAWTLQMPAAPGSLARYAIQYRKWDGTSWSTIQSLSTVDEWAGGTALGVDASGNPHVVWHQGVPGSYRIMYTKWDGATWSFPLNVSNTAGTASVPDLLIADSGDVHVTWTQSMGTYNGVYNADVMYTMWNGTGWSAAVNLSSNATWSGTSAMSAGPSGEVYVFWQDDSEILYKMLSGSSWSAVRNLSNNAGTSASPRATADPAGNMHVVWRDNTPVLGQYSSSDVLHTVETASADPPVLTLPGSRTAQFSDSISFSASATDADDSLTSLRFSATGLPTGVSLVNNLNGSATISGTIGAAAGSYTANITVTDPAGQTDTEQVVIVVSKESSQLAYSGDTMAAADSSITFRADFTQASDGALGDPTKAAVYFDVTPAGSTTTASYGPVAVSSSGVATWTLSSGLGTNIYNVVARVDSGNGYYTAAPSDAVILAVYNPAGGFVSGAGWIESPAGALRLTPESATVSGIARFGFVSQYLPGASLPTGKTQFQFNMADLKFTSDTYEWLVVAGARAQYKGVGTINGAGNYGFILTAVDEEVAGGGTADKFRIKIWDKNASDRVVYDNQNPSDSSDGAVPSTAIGGGSIAIHK